MNNIEEQIKTALEEVRPALQEDGGDIELLEIKDKKVKVKLQGACHGCPMARLTLKNGVENYLKEKVDKEIEIISEDIPTFE